MYIKKKINPNNLWSRALNIIPGGNSILSKRPQRYTSETWPIYFKKAEGYSVWDLNGKKYIDMAQMGIGSSILGYNNKFVNNGVKKIIDKGINTTLNSLEELTLAKKLLKLNPGYGGVKFARSGGEAMTVAVRIARSFSKKKKNYFQWLPWLV